MSEVTHEEADARRPDALGELSVAAQELVSTCQRLALVDGDVLVLTMADWDAFDDRGMTKFATTVQERFGDVLLVVLPPDTTLAHLTDGELARAGLIRAPQGETGDVGDTMALGGQH